MNAKSQNLPQPWVDPDDAPELTDEFFENAEYRIGDQLVSAGEGRAAKPISQSGQKSCCQLVAMITHPAPKDASAFFAPS